MRSVFCLLIAGTFACTTASPSSDDPSGPSQEGEAEAEGEGEGSNGGNDDADLLEEQTTDEACSNEADCRNDDDPCQVFSCNGKGYCTYHLLDNDGDGYVRASCGGSDCNDNDDGRDVYPGAERICLDGWDHDCDDINDCEQEEDTTNPTCDVAVDLTPGSGTMPDNCGDSGAEPGNDTLGGAVELDFTNGGYGCGGPCEQFVFDYATCYPGDIDYWRFHLSPGQALNVIVSPWLTGPDDDGDLGVALLNETGDVITTSDCLGNGPEEITAEPVDEDREYCLAIRGNVAKDYSIDFDLRP